MTFPQSAHTGGCWLLLCSLLPASTPTCCCSPQTWFVVTPHTASIPTPSDFTGHTDPAGNLILCSLTPLDTVIILQTSIQIPGTRLHSCHYTCPLYDLNSRTDLFLVHYPHPHCSNSKHHKDAQPRALQPYHYLPALLVSSARMLLAHPVDILTTWYSLPALVTFNT